VDQGIAKLDVADRARGLPDGRGDTFVAPATETHGPVHRGAFTNLLRPLRTDLGEVVGPDERRARAVGPMHDDDVLVRQGDAGIDARLAGRIPLGDLAGEDGGPA